MLSHFKVVRRRLTGSIRDPVMIDQCRAEGPQESRSEAHRISRPAGLCGYAPAVSEQVFRDFVPTHCKQGRVEQVRVKGWFGL